MNKLKFCVIFNTVRILTDEKVFFCGENIFNHILSNDSSQVTKRDNGAMLYGDVFYKSSLLPADTMIPRKRFVTLLKRELRRASATRK